MFLKLLTKIFSKKKYQKFNFLILHVVLKFMGYKNYGSYYETGEKFFIMKLKKHNIKTAIDIGANIGLYSKELLNIAQTKVISFEPMFHSFNQLKKLKEKNKKFHCYNVGLSDKSENRQIYYTNKFSQLSTISKYTKNIKFLKKYKFQKKKIRLTTLDNFFKKEKKLLFNGIDFIKIDTEGNDYKVICGGLKTINKFQPKFIQFEINSHNLFEGDTLFKFKNIMNNYNVYRMLPFNNGLMNINADFAENNIFHLSIYVLIKKGIKF
jgi:FkbM family methyltransferase